MTTATDVESADESLGTTAVLRSHGGRNAAMQMFHKRRQQKGRAPNHETTL